MRGKNIEYRAWKKRELIKGLCNLYGNGEDRKITSKKEGITMLYEKPRGWAIEFLFGSLEKLSNEPA